MSKIDSEYYHHPAILYDRLNDEKNSVLCRLCSHYCEIKDGNIGICLLRKNIGGELFTMTWGRTEGLAIDPIEKKPFYHYKPGTKVLSFGTPGCNFRCMNCQNWQLSQAVKYYSDISLATKVFLPESIAEYAAIQKVDGISYTYSEPTIFLEYARDTILECRKNKKTESLFHVFVSNGYFTKEAVELIDRENLLSAINIDLKFMDNQKYKKICGGTLEPVLDSIKRIYDLRDKIHLEIINLVIPGENDTDEDIEKLSDFIVSVSPDIPLHFSRFYPHYKLSNKPQTDLNTLIKAKEIAHNKGIKYIYIGNTTIPCAEDTHCPKCNELLIARSSFGIIKNNLRIANDKPICPKCKTEIGIII
ncbi:MAG: AmmeMemoRadiSam system radical SAM enzyme [Ignavibacteria bacterium GWB2_35_12]|nr:MAG: AmmeMemoRadiSam system radical SAM enzyme [Ignavibacteria bacterium GWA2_35_8]OGU40323.1 MAG: AmmeMemoRadiSam system radical SAM enzyme [Ignavibacteria bacterium GWB2_35_12]OGU93059.1 MAG: AmmeMemoRadiSam system radical SAM enzyme [Ignavibacteria bacterium RIFOXYA2_FULL_35_10]OGV24751.1 MAG: AmmeMemoRadiSam system radical SAM enzyme [Ignavibacteria bacterium RIFOXYC2_FULL_35_21]